jgi:DNA-binding NtrC family response regulator
MIKTKTKPKPKPNFTRDEIVSEELDMIELFLIREPVPLKQVVDKYIHWVLRRTGGSRIDSARILGISDRTIYNHIGGKK